MKLLLLPYWASYKHQSTPSPPTPPYSTFEIRDMTYSSLRKLSLAENTLTESLPQNPHQLQVLNLSNTATTSLHFLAKLSLKLPSLTSLRIHVDPISKQRTLWTRFFLLLTVDSLAPELINSLIIARFPSLELLNGSKITTLERENSEMYYLSKISLIGDVDLDCHPLYPFLIESIVPLLIPLLSLSP